MDAPPPPSAMRNIADLDARVSRAWESRGGHGAQGGEMPAMDEWVWDEWLWGHDPLEEAGVPLLLNSMHVLGLLLARYQAAVQESFHRSTEDMHGMLCNLHLRQGSQNQQAPPSPSMDQLARTLCMHDGIPVRKLTLRQLKDALENVRLQWYARRVVETVPTACATRLVDALFHRFGVLASQAWEMDVLDSQEDIERYAVPRSSSSHSSSSSSTAWSSVVAGQRVPTETHVRQDYLAHSKKESPMLRLNRQCIRRFVNVFLGLYRSIFLWDVKDPCDEALPPRFDTGIRLHHIVAASDDFSKVSMHWDLPISSKTNYVHDFSGFFNCISQVVYCHNPDYQRRAQDKKRVVEISRALAQGFEDSQITLVHIIPPVTQMYPDVEVCYADETGDLVQRAQQGKASWLFAGRTLYLVCPPAKNHASQPSMDPRQHPYSCRMRVLFSGMDVAPLIHLVQRLALDE